MTGTPLDRLLGPLGDEPDAAGAANRRNGDPWAGEVEPVDLTDDQEDWLARFDDQPPIPRLRGDFLGE